MPIPLPNLDDRTFADLVEEMRALIPRYAPTWTDHNVSDPGIMLIDLFAWLTEALIYRLNRIPETSEARFLELLGTTFHSARPARVTLTVTADGLEGALTVPEDTPLVVDHGETGETLPFETVYDLRLTPEEPSGTVKASQTVQVGSERLGVSNGQPHQVFPLAQPFLVLEPSGLSPLVPEVAVDRVAWTLKPSLVNSTSRDNHFTVEPRLSLVRFGDGNLGQIPLRGAEITVSYRSTLGREGNVTSGAQFRIDKNSRHLDDSLKRALDSGISFSIFSKADASDGTNPTRIEEARAQATSALKTRWRAISAEDFEELIMGQPDLNIARVKCLAELDLTAPDPDTPRQGHVSVIIVPDTPEERPRPTPKSIDQVWSLLDDRRLITCRHHVLGPGYTDLRIQAGVVRHGRIKEKTLRDQIEKTLRTFFHPLKGGPDKKGWPFGRDVHASEVYQVMEGTEGVDHVESLTLETREEGGDWTGAGDHAPIAPNNLVHFDFSSSMIHVWVAL